MIRKLMTRRVRKYLYGVSIAAIPLLVFVGWLPPQSVPLIVPLVVALLNLTPPEQQPAAGE